MASNSIVPPPVDARTEDDLVQQTSALGTFYTTNQPSMQAWSPGADLGSALVRVFARLMSHVIERLNQVPENNHLAFLGLLGAQQLPPLPARVPLTFQLVPGSNLTAVVPAYTPVAAPAGETTPEAVFTTESELVLTAASLTAVLVRRPEIDAFTDCTSIATEGVAPGAFVAFGGAVPTPGDRLPAPEEADTLVEHSLYISDPIFALRSGSVTLTVALTLQKPIDLVGLRDNALLWSCGPSWSPLSSTADAGGAAAPSTSWTVSVTVPLPVPSSLVDGQSLPWVRATWHEPVAPTDLPPVVSMQSIAVALSLPTQAPDGAFSDTTAVDLSKDFLPFGTRPQLGDTFYLSSTDTLQPGVSVVLSVVLSAGLTNLLPLTLTWEIWTRAGWLDLTQLDPTADPPTSLGFADNTGALSTTGTVTFTVPAGVQPTSLNGVLGTWMRIRVSAPVAQTADFTLTPFKNYSPPSLQSVTATITALGATQGAITTGRSKNGSTYQPWTAGQGPFAAIAATQPAIYLGFDQPFSNQAMTIYFQVDPSTADEARAVEPAAAVSAPPPPPRVAWEYFASTNGWAALSADDETVTLSRSGLLHFIGPTDFEASSVFGRPGYWIRGRLVGGALPVQRRLGRISLNTVWASSVATIENELLGASNGNPDQSFVLAQTPVLLGQRIEVNESELPAPDELATLGAVEGADTVTVVPASAGNLEQIWVRWHEVSDFYASGPLDRHYVIDHLTGTLQFGNGSNGRIPIAGAQNLRAAWYQSGGGAAGNRSPGSITQLRTALPYVQGVVNYEAAAGGADAETLERLKDRSSRVLRHGGRAVTAQDFEDLAFQASSIVSRAVAIMPTFDPVEQSTGPVPLHVRHRGKVFLIIVPSSAQAQPVPSPALLTQIHDYLTARCAPAVELQVTGPNWCAVTVSAEIALTSLDASETVLANVHAAIDRFLHPLTGNNDGNGWAFGQQPHASDFYLQFSKIAGIDHVNSLTVTCTPPLEFDAGDPRSSDLDMQRFVQTNLVYSSGKHSITLPSLGAASAVDVTGATR